MRTITLLYPKKIIFGNDSINNFVSDFINTGYRNLFLVTTSPILNLINSAIDELRKNDINVVIEDNILTEPTINSFLDILKKAKNSKVDSVIGIGGGSVLDIAKLTAALLNNTQSIENVIGIDKLNSRNTFLACLPTTSGTGSEVSPNAILLDEKDKIKKGTISPFLIPDAVYIDPKLTLTVPPKITAATGMDALTHCIEAYTNKFSHPIIDLYALEGIKLISRNLKIAFENGENLEAREKLSLGSLYGGFCLGPVNTAAVHALSYPLGGEFHIPHGLSNAVLLPYVMEFNLEEAVNKYAEVSIALGAEKGKDNYETAKNGVKKIFNLCKELDIQVKLSSLNIPKDAIDKMAEGAIQVERLLKNNPRKVSLEDVKKIYLKAY